MTSYVCPVGPLRRRHVSKAGVAKIDCGGERRCWRGGGGPTGALPRSTTFDLKCTRTGRFGVVEGPAEKGLRIVVFRRQEGKKLEGCCCWREEKERSYGSNGDGGGPTGMHHQLLPALT